MKTALLQHGELPVLVWIADHMERYLFFSYSRCACWHLTVGFVTFINATPLFDTSHNFCPVLV